MIEHMTMLDEKIEVMKAARDGHVIESRPFDYPRGIGWRVDDAPAWNWQARDYRIHVPGHDVIPWSFLASRFVWAARDEDGRTYAYSNKPERGPGVWLGKGFTPHRLDILLDIKHGGRPWHGTLQRRPEAGEIPAPSMFDKAGGVIPGD